MSQKTTTYDRIKEFKPVKEGNDLGFNGQNYLVALNENDVYALAVGAYYVWNLCKGEKTVEELVKDITAELSSASENKESINEEELKEPVAIILEQLAKAGLISYK